MDTDPGPGPDFVSSPEGLARANAEARIAHLAALTVESAARELEAIFAVEAELEAARAALGLPPLPLPPLPRGGSLAVLLAGSQSAWEASLTRASSDSCRS